MGWGRGEGRGVEGRGREGGRQAVTERSDVTACCYVINVCAIEMR